MKIRDNTGNIVGCSLPFNKQTQVDRKTHVQRNADDHNNLLAVINKVRIFLYSIWSIGLFLMIYLYLFVPIYRVAVVFCYGLECALTHFFILVT